MIVPPVRGRGALPSAILKLRSPPRATDVGAELRTRKGVERPAQVVLITAHEMGEASSLHVPARPLSLPLFDLLCSLALLWPQEFLGEQTDASARGLCPQDKALTVAVHSPLQAQPPRASAGLSPHLWLSPNPPF